MPFSVNLSLCLPRDELSVPVARHICRFALEELGVADSCIHDIELAMTEACTNVLDHATGEDCYAVDVEIGEQACTIRVKDTGGGFDQHSLSTAAPTAESGRGIALMQALVDRVNFTSVPEAGMIVHLEKALQFDGGHPVPRRLTSSAR